MADATGIAREQLKSIVERIERLEEEKAALADDIKEVYAEAKANGFDTKTLRTVIRLRKQDSAERQEQEALLDLYLHALGMVRPRAEGVDEPRRCRPGCVCRQVNRVQTRRRADAARVAMEAERGQVDDRQRLHEGAREAVGAQALVGLAAEAGGVGDDRLVEKRRHLAEVGHGEEGVALLSGGLVERSSRRRPCVSSLVSVRSTVGRR